ncbi:glycosyltransferase family 2 protein [Parapedobacter sp. 10938]|uniref:glycosyltransferase family 2 protein n=1 Tax=Parapedobacter flavus TaxID=3110225 RepID=UPI002DBDF14F|nr:glycosyltransferase family 2 protein [Parapedobacter sp. 10938]MEC3881228.1 glycosyltransferase family 2 protein [Parapedobacter sp. 10938]
MPEFSICIPAYKSRFLAECIASILRQSYVDFEVIVLNDCSPEPVEEIVRSFSDTRIRYYENESNVGPLRLTDNWNRCVALAEGAYVVIMGDDDRLERDYLEEFMTLMTHYPGLDVYHCRSLIIDDSGDAIRLTPAGPSFERVCDHIWHRLNQWRSQYISDFVYRREALSREGGCYALPLAWGSDDITAYKACAGKGMAHTNRPVFNYRHHNLSITSTGNDLEKMRANVLYAVWLRGFLADHIPHEAEEVVYRNLLEQQDRLMQQRKQFTMALSMRRHRARRFWMWYKHRKEFGLRLHDIILAAVKAQGLAKRM